MAYLFPIMETRDITQFFKEYPLSTVLTEADLKNPQKAKWQQFYEGVLHYFFNVETDKLSQFDLEAIDSLGQNPELFSQSIPVMHLAVCMRYIMTKAKVTNFSLADIIEPTSKKCIRNCSALINFILFRETRDSYIKEIMMKKQSIDEKIQDLAEQTTAKLAKIEEIKSKKIESEPEVAQIQEKLNEIHDKMPPLLKEINEKKKKLLQLSQEFDDKKLGIVKLKETITENRNRENQLAKKIVQSPKRFISEMEQLEQTIAEKEAIKVEKQHCLARVTTDLLYEQLRETMLGANQFLQDVDEISAKCTQLSRDIAEKKSENVRKHDESVDLSIKLEQQQEIVSMKHDRQARLRSKHSMQIGALKQEIESLKNVRDSIKEGDNDPNTELVKHMTLLREKGRMEFEKHQKIMTDLKLKHRSSVDELQHFHEELDNLSKNTFRQLVLEKNKSLTS